MTIGSRRELRRDAVRWLRVAGLVVVALVAIRMTTAPRSLTSIALAPVTDSDPVSIAAAEITTVEDTVEVRKIRRARPLDPSQLTPCATFLGMALLAAAALARRHDPRVSVQFASRAVPVLGGRAPPLPSH